MVMVMVPSAPAVPAAPPLPVLPGSPATAPLSSDLLFWLPIVFRLLRDRLHLSQSQIAARMNTQRIYISKIESHPMVPVLGTFLRIAAALESSPWEILRLCEWMRDGE